VWQTEFEGQLVVNNCLPDCQTGCLLNQNEIHNRRLEADWNVDMSSSTGVSKLYQAASAKIGEELKRKQILNS